MARLTTLKDKIQYRIKKSKETVFLVSDFMDLTGRVGERPSGHQ